MSPIVPGTVTSFGDDMDVKVALAKAVMTKLRTCVSIFYLCLFAVCCNCLTVV